MGESPTWLSYDQGQTGCSGLSAVAGEVFMKNVG